MPIGESLASIMKKINAVAKQSKNEKQGYKYRGVDDVMSEIHRHFAEEGIICLPKILAKEINQRASKSGGDMMHVILEVEYTLKSPDGSSVSGSVTGEGMDSGDKACNKALAGALKYFLTQALTIPTAEPKDSEIESPELGESDPRVIGKELRAKLQSALTEGKISQEQYGTACNRFMKEQSKESAERIVKELGI